MKTRIVKCTICKKEIKVYRKTSMLTPYSNFGSKLKSDNKAKRTFAYSESKHGVLFGQCSWFCNDCWKEIMDFVEANKS